MFLTNLCAVCRVVASAFEPAIPQRATGPTYDAAYLSELKANTPSTRPPLPTDSQDARMDVDVGEPSQLSALAGV